MKHDLVGVEIQSAEIHGAVSPGSVRIPHGVPGLYGSLGKTGHRAFEKELPGLRDEGLQGLAVHDVPGRNGRVAVVEVFLRQVRCIEIESGKQHVREPDSGPYVRGGIAGGSRDIGQVERPAIPGGGGGEGGPGRRRVGEVGRVDPQYLQDRTVNQGVEKPAGQRHVPRVYEYPLGRKQHEVGGTGTVGTPLLPEETCDVNRLCRGLLDFLAQLISDRQRELHQTGAAVFHLLSRHGRSRRRSHTGRKWTELLRLRRGGGRAGSDAGQHEQASHRN